MKKYPNASPPTTSASINSTTSVSVFCGMVISNQSYSLTKKFITMETSNKKISCNILSRIFLTFFSVLFSVLVFAQEATKKIDIDINSNSGGGFFASPWIWVVGIAVFVLLLVALLRGSGRRSV